MKQLTIHLVLIALTTMPFFATAQFPSSAATRNRIWTLAEVKAWSAQNKNQRWKGMLLYQGSDSASHHFISRIMDEWMWFVIKRTDVSLPEVKQFSKRSSAPLGYYYVDPQHNYTKVSDY